MSSVTKKHDVLHEIRWQIWPLRNIKFLWFCFSSMFASLFVCPGTCYLTSFGTISWLWAESIALHTSKCILLLLSAVTSSINTRGHACPYHHMPPPCSTDDVIVLYHELFFSFSILLSSNFSNRNPLQVKLGFIYPKIVFKMLYI